MRDFTTYAQKRKAAKRRRKILYALCAAMILGAGWVLMRPAITLSDAPECGLEAHTHTEDCYSWETGPAPFLCTLDYHEHGDDCYDPEGNLLCSMEEHVHTADCYGAPEEYQVLTCETPEHTHSDDCYSLPDPTPDYILGPVLDCGMAEHIHGDTCYDGEDLICTIPEHTHTDRCMEEPTEETKPAWDSLTEEEKRQELLSMLHVEEEEEETLFDTLLETYEKDLNEIHTILLDHTPEKAGEAAIETLEDLRGYLEATESTVSTEPAEDTEPTEEAEPTEAADETEATEPTEAADPTAPAEVTVEDLLKALTLGSPEDRAALESLLERTGKTPAELLALIRPETAEAEPITTLEALRARLEPTVEEPLSPEEKAALEQIQTQLQIESNEDKQALSELLKTYSLKPSEILEYLKLMQEDPETEQVRTLEELKALMEAAMGVQTLGAEDGKFTFVTGTTAEYRAALTVGDYLIQVVASSGPADAADYKLVVDWQVDTCDVNEAHGVLKGGYKKFNLDVQNTVDASKKFPADHPVSYTIQRTDAKPFVDLVVYLGGELIDKSGTAYNADHTQVCGTFEGDAANGFSLVAEEVLLCNGWEMADDTFLSDGGSYSIGYILSNYNVFLELDYVGSHVVGPFIIGGTATMSGNLGGVSAGEEMSAPHTVPDYLGGYGAQTAIIVTARDETPVYFGEKMYRDQTGVEIKCAANKTSDNYWYAKQYVSFADAWQDIAEEARNVASDGALSAEESARLLTDSGVGTGKQLPAGNTYTFPGNTFSLGQVLDLKGLQPGQDTTIILTGTEVTIPWIYLDGTVPDGQAESGYNSGIVFICPDATSVKGNQVTGHLVAPNANVEYSGGFYNGCVIAKSLNATGTEGHMWPYNGSRLTPAKTPVQATKYMNGEPLPMDSEYHFQFALYQQTRVQAEDGTSAYSYADTPAVTGTNTGPNVTFGYTEFNTAGDFVYKMVEQTDGDHPGILFDARAYYAKIHVVKNGSRFQATISYYKDEGCTQPLDDGVTYPVFNNRYGEKLPDTGGGGTAIFVLPGIGLLSLALMAAILQWKRREA